MVQAYWQIGGVIVEHEQNGSLRAEYGKANTQCQLPCQSRMEATRSSFSLLGS
ncbi:MAG: hypothetical protein IJG36_11320 [Synergistaceae bacterium]|nr:hypothetical protein [Synergistaceae bacterium]